VVKLQFVQNKQVCFQVIRIQIMINTYSTSAAQVAHNEWPCKLKVFQQMKMNLNAVAGRGIQLEASRSLHINQWAESINLSVTVSFTFIILS